MDVASGECISCESASSRKVLEARFGPTREWPTIRTQGCKLSDVDPRGTELYINSERIVAVDY